jgi:uncharacterized protein
MARRNPFEYGRELNRAELVDRRDEIRDIEAAIRNRGKLFLIGPRRFGKTSLLAASSEGAGNAGAIVIRQDAEKYETLDLLAAAILADATKALTGPVEKAIALIGKVARRLRPKISFDGQAFSVELDDSGSADQLPLLTAALDAVEALAGETGREVVVIIDEFQQVVTEHGPAAEKQIRSTIQKHRRVSYVFAGSHTRLLHAMTSDPNRPFYRLGSRLFLGPVPREEFSAYLIERFAKDALILSPKAAELLLMLADDVPYNVQRLAHEAWEMAQEVRADRKKVVVDDTLIERALERVVRREDPAYTQLWTSLTQNRKKALKAVIRYGGTGLQKADALREIRISSSSLVRALNDLESGHFIRTESAGGATKYRLVDPFFAHWLRVFQGPPTFSFIASGRNVFTPAVEVRER